MSIYLRDKKFLFNKDFLFESNHDVFTIFLNNMSNFYTYVCNCNLIFIHVKNDLYKSVIISFKTRLELLIKYEKKEYFSIKSDFYE